MRLHTTTWKCRNSDRLQRLMDAAAARGPLHPVIMDIGPGAASTLWMYVHPPGKTREWKLGQRIRGGLARLGDSVVRSLPFGSLCCPELEEVYALSTGLQPRRIDVVDIEPRVLRAASKVARHSHDDTLFRFHRIDVSAGPLPLTADLVIAYQVIERTADPQSTLRTIAAAVRPGGLLSVVTSLNIEGMDKIENGLWARPASLT